MKSRKAYSILVVFNFIFLFKLIAVSFNMAFSIPPFAFASLLSIIYLSFIFQCAFNFMPVISLFPIMSFLLILIECNSFSFIFHSVLFYI